MSIRASIVRLIYEGADFLARLGPFLATLANRAGQAVSLHQHEIP